MTCPNCGAANEDGRKFCGECGHGLALACPSCGAANPPAVKFCGECGTALQGSRIERAAPTAERRTVSVLFADLVGFTSLSESRDAEEVRELLSRYFDTCKRLIGLYGGTVEKFIGDAVMAVWGAPTAQEDDAERAVRTALDLVAAISALGDEVGAPELRARAGVLTGEAAVTIGAEGEGMVAGDLVNTASRIQATAQAGTVLVGEATKNATEAAIAYEEAGTHALKGKTEPLALWRAMRVTSGRAGARRSEGLEPPFVGRERELRLVKELLHGSIEERKSHLVSVVGIAGIGKSRLGWEFFKYVDGLAQPVWWWRGRCLAYGEGVTYWALAEMVRTRADIVEGEDPATARPKLREALAPYIEDVDELDWIEPHLAHLLGLEERAAEREDLFAAWRLYFERLTQHQPAVLVFEDMQWADPSLLEFVEYLLEWSRNHPIYVLTLARPELQQRHPSWGAGKRNFSSLYLEPLSPESMEALLDGFVPGLPDDVRSQVLQRAEGVPLYAVETVRMLLDRGLLERSGAQYRPTGEIGALEIPETLHALVAARLDGLETEERGLVQDASVLGKTFTKQALAALHGTSEEHVEPLLGSLVRKEVLSLQADPRSPERGQYGFLQDLLRQVAYETLARRDRKQRHLAAADYLEEGWGPAEQEIAEIVASHYVAAVEAEPEDEDAAEIASKAATMLARAGERAASLAASEEAQRYFDQAATFVAGSLEEAELRERAGEMAWRARDADTAFDQLSRALSLFETAGATHPAARVSARLGEVEWQARGGLEQALARMEAAFAVLSAEEPDADVASLAAQLGRFHFFRGELELARERTETALTLAEELLLPEIISQALNTSGLIALWQGRQEAAFALTTHALTVALEHDRSAAALRAYLNLGELLCQRDRYEAAFAAYDEGLALARKVGDRGWETLLAYESAYPLLLTGRWEEARARIGEVPLGEAGSIQALSCFYVTSELDGARGATVRLEEDVSALASRLEQSSDVQERAGFAAVKARALQTLGRDGEALAAAERAIEEIDHLGWAGQPGRVALVTGIQAALALGDLDRADELITMIESRRPGAAPLYLRAQAARLRAQLSAARGEQEKIESRLKSAAGTFRELGLPFWTAVVELELAEWLADQERQDEAEPYAASALEAFERLDATVWIERANRLAGQGREAELVIEQS